MKIERIAVNVFEHPTRIVRDSAGHAHASPERHGKARLAMLRVVTEDGTEGYSFGPPEVIRPFVIDGFVRKDAGGPDPPSIASGCGARSPTASAAARASSPTARSRSSSRRSGTGRAASSGCRCTS